MILVRNHPLRLSGSNVFLICLCLSIILSGCGIFGPIIPKKKEEPIEQPKDSEEPEEPEVPIEEPEKVEAQEVVLILPLQLNRIQQNHPSIEDVKRVMIPLDFYQGFRIGIETLSDKGHNFEVTVLDSRDNQDYSRTLSQSEEVQTADLIVGPIFPKEIQAFSGGLHRDDVLQVSPLAASTSAQFDVPNLVSLVAPVTGHARGLVAYLKSVYDAGDNVFLYNNQDPDSHKFLSPIRQYLREAGIELTEVHDLEDIESECTLSGRNVFIMGTTNRFALMSALTSLTQLKGFGYSIDLYGHPNWAKLNLDPKLLDGLNARITASSYIDPSNKSVRLFQQRYMEAFKVEPSEYAYKGYDTGYFFGYMLTQYGADYMKFLGGETYKGLQTNYVFETDSDSGFVNTYIRILEFDGYNYRPIEN